jgi:hypothetical protein
MSWEDHPTTWWDVICPSFIAGEGGW